MVDKTVLKSWLRHRHGLLTFPKRIKVEIKIAIIRQAMITEEMGKQEHAGFYVVLTGTLLVLNVGFIYTPTALS